MHPTIATDIISCPVFQEQYEKARQLHHLNKKRTTDGITSVVGRLLWVGNEETCNSVHKMLLDLQKLCFLPDCVQVLGTCISYADRLKLYVLLEQEMGKLNILVCSVSDISSEGCSSPTFAHWPTTCMVISCVLYHFISTILLLSPFFKSSSPR